MVSGSNLYIYPCNPLGAIDPHGLREICLHNYFKISSWKIIWSEEEWKKTGEVILLTGVSGACYWTKYKKGLKKREVTDMLLCWDSCNPNKTYPKRGNTKVQKERFKDIIDTDMTPIHWIRPVGGFAWVYNCDRSYRNPLLPNKK